MNSGLKMLECGGPLLVGQIGREEGVVKQKSELAKDYKAAMNTKSQDTKSVRVMNNNLVMSV